MRQQLTIVGQVANLRPIANRPAEPARPAPRPCVSAPPAGQARLRRLAIGAQVGNPMPLVFCPAISAGSTRRSGSSTQSPVFAWARSAISVPRFLQVSGRGKNEWHWIANRPRAGPAIIFRTGHEPCLHWIHLNVVECLLKFAFISHQAVKAFALPEWAAPAEHSIALRRRVEL